MIYKLVCAGKDSFIKVYQKDENETLIAVDGGYKTLVENNIKIDYFFGDYDSLNNNDIECVQKFEYPTIKDKGDFELTIDYLINELKINDNDQVFVYNATGGRLDHYYAILNVLKKYNNYNIYLLDENNKIYFINNNSIIKKTNYKYISFFSDNDNTIISIEGCKYNLSNYNLKANDNLCLSNEIIDDCIIKTNNFILVIESN